MAYIDATLIDLPHYADESGGLTVLEGESVIPFAIKRAFIVYADAGEVRGRHAHKKCNQFMICSSGVVEVVINDGKKEMIYLLDKPSIGLMVPPSLWAHETYKTQGSVLTVLCDRPYEVEDYIHKFDEFTKIYGENSDR